MFIFNLENAQHVLYGFSNDLLRIKFRDSKRSAFLRRLRETI
jgi:hypothetical protein